MATQQSFLVCDLSTLANFKSWGSALSAFILSCGWTQSSDTGQVNWTTIASVPTSGNYVYEVWQPGDALTNFYLKVEYGNTGSAPTMRLSAATATNGAGTLTAFFTSALVTASSNYTGPSTTTTYECDFSGDSGRLSILLWRNAPNSAPQVFAVQRSLNSSGSPTGDYVTLWTAGNAANNGPGGPACQQSLDFATGPAPLLRGRSFGTNNFCGWACLGGNFTDNGSSAFNSGIPLSNASPCVGKWDFPCTVVGTSWSGDITEGVPFSITNQYGQTKTYMPTKNGVLPSVSLAMTTAACCIEYD